MSGFFEMVYNDG